MTRSHTVIIICECYIVTIIILTWKYNNFIYAFSIMIGVWAQKNNPRYTEILNRFWEKCQMCFKSLCSVQYTSRCTTGNIWRGFFFLPTYDRLIWILLLVNIAVTCSQLSISRRRRNNVPYRITYSDVILLYSIIAHKRAHIISYKYWKNFKYYNQWQNIMTI